MTRNLNTFGLAMLIILAFNVIAAPGASAQGKLTSDGPVTLRVTETGEVKQNGLTAFGVQNRCPGSVYTGHNVLTTAETGASKEHKLIPTIPTAATLTPHYKEVTAEGKPNCVATIINGTTTIEMNGCDYVVHIGTTKAADEYNITFDVVCPTGKEITIVIFHNGNAAHAGTPYCTIHVPPQVNLAGAIAKKTASGHIGITGEVVGIDATATSHGTILCPHQTTSNAKLDIDVTVAGQDATGAATPIEITESC